MTIFDGNLRELVVVPRAVTEGSQQVPNQGNALGNHWWLFGRMGDVEVPVQAIADDKQRQNARSNLCYRQHGTENR